MSKNKENLLDCGVLIVEDDYLGRVVLKEIFKKRGFTRIEEAENGQQGLEKINSFKPDLVILDVMMPEMDGVECCKRIRANPDPRVAHLPVLVQTALEGRADRTRIFEAGATDYLSKPVDPHEITSRAIAHMERELMNRSLREFNARMIAEINTARTTQLVLIPDETAIAETEKDYRMSICSHYQPCSELGGDFWGMKSLSSEELAVYMIDFSGHGVNAALNVFRLHALMQAAMDTARTPGAYLSHLNAILTPLLPPEQFATMFYGVINVRDKTLSYASAASPPPVLFNNRGKSYRLLESNGGLLGAFKELTYQSDEVAFSPGDCLFLYSDALIETPDGYGNMRPIEVWAEKFQRSLKRERNQCNKAFSALLSSFREDCEANLADDLTLAACVQG